jgi:hypothetical protein
MRRLHGRPPYTVVGFVGVVATVLVVLLIADASDPYLLTGGLVLVVASFGLLRGIWLAWLFLTAVAAGDLVYTLFTWGTVLINGTLLALLLASPTRRYTRRGRPRLRGWLGAHR